MMTDEFRAEWVTRRRTWARGVHDAITLASLVEREARRPDERALVASVFHNRLKLGMRLDCDPTTVYAALIEHRYRGTIYRSDLANTSLWNTYQHAGLPPGPIASPGLGSIKACCNGACPATGYPLLRSEKQTDRAATISSDSARRNTMRP